GRLHNRQIRRFRAFEDATGINAYLTVRIRNVASVSQQAASLGILTPRIYRRNCVSHRQKRQLKPSAVEEGVAADEESVWSLAHKIRERLIDLAAGAGVEDVNLQSHSAGSQSQLPQRRLGNPCIDRIDKRCNTGGCRHQLTQEFQLLRRQLTIEKI